MKQSVLIVDDMPDMLKYLSRLLRKTLDVEPYTALDAETALEIVAREHICVVLSDIRMPKMDGIEFLKKVKCENDSIIVVMMTAFGSIESAVQSLKLGAYDYVTKPFDEERLVHILRKALEHHRLEMKTLDLERTIKAKEAMDSLVGRSRPVMALMETIRQAARTEATVLIRGETGTGKDLTAKLLHSLSARSKQPFVAVNCPAIPENILESELFGYKKGAFTGANNDREGLFEAANRGTIFLDEIGDISPLLQAKLLRALQEKEIKPLGDNCTRKVDVRIIASTNRNLEEKIARSEFRDDLYYRLNVVSIHTPSLRDIPEDIPLVANHFLSRYCAELGVAPKRLSGDALKMLVAGRWSGNVRELQNVIKRAIIFSAGEVIGPDKFDAGCPVSEAAEDCRTLQSDDPSQYKDAKKKVIDKFNVRFITHALAESGGNVSVAARNAGLERQSLQYLMKKHGIDAGRFRGGAK
jgi:DNA-binding NtrC family response regulator